MWNSDAMAISSISKSSLIKCFQGEEQQKELNVFLKRINNIPYYFHTYLMSDYKAKI